MTAENFIKAQLAAFVHREAAFHGGIDNMLAVAFVIRNRVRAGWMGGSWMGVIQSAETYSATIYTPTALDLREFHFRLLMQQIDDIYSGLMPDRMTDGALFYAELNRVEREWFKQNILAHLDEHPRVATVGNVSFFK